MLRINSPARSLDALATEMPTPLIRATHMATQTGHLGSNTRVALGTIQPANSPTRRQRKGRRGASPQRCVAIQQQRHPFIPASPTRRNMTRLY